MKANIYIMHELLAYGCEIIRACEQNKSIAVVRSYAHGTTGLNMYCKECSMVDANRIAVPIMAHANSEFKFKELKIYLISNGHELGFYEFDGDDVVFKARMKLRIEEETRAQRPLSNPQTPTIEKIHISGPCTVIIWSDKTKTMVRLQDGEPYDAEKAVYAAIAKKFIGTNRSKSNWLDIIREKMSDEQHNNAFYGVEKK